MTAALLVVVALFVTSCGSSGSSGDPASTNQTGEKSKDSSANMETTGSQGSAEQNVKEKTSGKSGMARMGHGRGSGGMASGMLMKDGKYSDERFIDSMVPHHKGAVDMARVALKNADHPEIRNLAKNIISTQKTEIKTLKSIKKEEYGKAGVPMKMSPKEMKSMGMTMKPQKFAKQQPFDRAFIDNMIPHHQSAVKMARVALKDSDNAKIKKLAQEIASAQEREISQMKKWRGKWYPEG